MSLAIPIPDIASYPDIAALPANGQLTEQAIRVHRNRYSLRVPIESGRPDKVNIDPTSETGAFTDQAGKQWFATETFLETCWRVAWVIASAEPTKKEEHALTFFDSLYNQQFVPNSPTWWAAGLEDAQLSACFVVGPEGIRPGDPDSMEAYYGLMRACGMITHSGGGIGIHLGAFRPKGSPVRGGAHGSAFGPITVLRTISYDNHGLTQRGKREAAGMCILPVYHPDVLEFIRSKTQEGTVHNFNISVGITDDFMEAVLNDDEFWLTHPKWVPTLEHFPEDARPHIRIIDPKDDGCYINARWLFDQLVNGAHRNGEPGIFFVDRANEGPWRDVGITIRGTNPCGEQPLPDFGVCNLGHVNLAKCVVYDVDGKGHMDWDRLRRLTWMGVRFLDDVIDVNNYPLPEITKRAEMYRNIGLGITGYADLLCELGIKYGSPEALKLAAEIEAFRFDEATRASRRLAQERGSPWGGDRRNLVLLTVAPTGTTSQIVGVEGSGIEPIFGPGYWRKDHVHNEGVFVPTKYANNPAFMCAVSRWPTSDGQSEHRPEFEVTPTQHVATQAAFQSSNDSAISKTINLPKTATTDDIKRAFVQAWESGCKGITVYRDGSREVEVLSSNKKEGKFDPQAALKTTAAEEEPAIATTIFEPVYAIEELPDDAPTRRLTLKYKGKKVRLFVVENEHGEPRELYAKTPGLFDQEMPTLDALCRITSLALRGGVPLEKVIEQFEDSKGTLNQDNYAQLILAGLAPYAEQEAPVLDQDDDLIGDIRPTESVETSKDECPSCGAALKWESGCKGCSANCGYSKCG